MIVDSIVVVLLVWVLVGLAQARHELRMLAARPTPKPEPCAFTPSKCHFKASVPCEPTRCEAAQVTAIAPTPQVSAEIIHDLAIRVRELIVGMRKTPELRSSNGRAELRAHLAAREAAKK